MRSNTDLPSAHDNGKYGLVAKADITRGDEIAILEALDRLCASKALSGGDRLPRILRYIVREELEGRGSALKGYTIASDVLGRSSAFDDQSDAAVRADMARLRRALELYYATDGAREPIRFILPRGTYAPLIERPSDGPEARTGSLVDRNGRAWRLKTVAWASLIGLALMVVGLVAIERFMSPPARGPVLALRVVAVPGAPEQAASFALGLGGELLARLIEAPWLTVIDDEAGDTANTIVDYRLIARVPPSPQTEDVSALLTRADDGAVLWTGRYPVETLHVDLRQLSSAVAAAIASDLTRSTGALMSAEMRKGETDDASIRQFACIVTARRYWRTYTAEDSAAARACVSGLIDAGEVIPAIHAIQSLLHIEDARRLDGDDRKRKLDAAKAELAFSGDGPLALSAQMALAACQGDTEFIKAVARRRLDRHRNDPATLADAGTKLGLAAGEWTTAIALEREAMAINPRPDPWYPMATAVRHLLDGDAAGASALLEATGQRGFIEGRIVLLDAAGISSDRRAVERHIAILRERGVMSVAAAMQRASRACWSADVIQAVNTGLAQARQLVGEPETPHSR